MKLFYRKSGQGQPLIIIHGLFGQSDNWNTLAKQFAEKNLEVYVVDARNHGLSPKSEVWNYKAMSEDILELIIDNNLHNVILLGHSMGGKIAMQFAIDHPEYLDKLIVADIAPKQYPPQHKSVIEGLLAVDFNIVKTRKEVDDILSKYISDYGTKQFLLKNIYWKDDGQLDWRFNLKVIVEQNNNVGEAISANKISEVETLFIRGEYGNYILDEDISLIREIFPRSMLETIKGAGHWVHAEKPKEFFDCVMGFIK
ncbi:MAG: alpha/beta fold hydrolase [Bacteroidia bacterium]